MSPVAGQPPDAGISILGTWGLRNPMTIWLLNRHPELLAETPLELREHNDRGSVPRCGWFVESPHVKGVVVECGGSMHFRYVYGRPAWVCFAHPGDDPSYPYAYFFVERPPAKLNREPAFDLWREIGAALEGQISDLEFDRGEWKIVHR